MCMYVFMCVCTYLCAHHAVHALYLFSLSRSINVLCFPTPCLLSSHCQHHLYLSLLFFHSPLSHFHLHFNPLHSASSFPLSSFIFFPRLFFSLLLFSLFLFYLPPSLLLLSTSPHLVLSNFSLLYSPTHIRNVQFTTPYRNVLYRSYLQAWTTALTCVWETGSSNKSPNRTVNSATLYGIF